MTGPVDTRHLRELDAQATPGPWMVGKVQGPDSYGMTWQQFYGADGDACVSVYPHPNDAELIVAARNSLPHLLDAAEERDRLLDELDQARAALTFYADEGLYRDLGYGSVFMDKGERARVALRGEGAR